MSRTALTPELSPVNRQSNGDSHGPIARIAPAQPDWSRSGAALAASPAELAQPESSTSSRREGFRANLSCASLPDLVQMECLAQSCSAFRVTSEHRVGYLFFSAGQIVHAVTGDDTGECAALEILKWRFGTFDACNLALPEVATIGSNWQHLLLRAAQSRDESGRHELSALSGPDERGAEPGTEHSTLLVRSQLATSSAPDSDPTRRAPGMSSHAPEPAPKKPTRTERVELAVRLDARGNVLGSRGDVGEFAQVAAYAARLAQLIGADLGMGDFMGLECVSEHSRSLIHVEKSGHVLAVQARLETDLSSLRTRFGLSP